LYDRLNRVKRTVTMATLQSLFEDRTATVSVQGWLPNQGQQQRVVQESAFAPVTVCRRARNKLDEIFVEYGWLPDVETVPRTEITAEDMEKIEEWRQQNLAD